MSLFLTTAEFKTAVDVNAQISFNTLQPFINDAQELYLVNLLGQTFYDSFVADYGSDAAVTGDNVALLPYVQRALAYYTMYEAVDQLSLNVGDAGIVQSRGNNDEPVPKWKFDNLKKRYLTKADLHAEKLLKYLEDNASVSKYSAWFSSDANTTAEGLIVSTVRVASNFIEINDSRRIFKRLKRYIREIEQGFIQKSIGAAQYDEIVAQIKDGTLSADDENIALVAKLKPIICKKALYELIPTLRISITENGLTMYSSSDGVISQTTASKEDIKTLRYSLKESESGYIADINDLKQFIIDNIDDYALIESSTAYTSRPSPGPQRPPVNLSDNKSFSV